MSTELDRTIHDSVTCEVIDASDPRHDEARALYNAMIDRYPRLKTIPSADPFPPALWGRRTCALTSCYDGSRADGEAAMQAVRDATPEPLLDAMEQLAFKDLQALFDPLIPPGLQWYWKGEFIESLSDEAIAAHVEFGSSSPSELSLMHLYPIDGAVQDVGAQETAWGARNARWSMVIAGIDPDPDKAGALERWARDYWQAIHDLSTHGGAYINFMNDDEGEARVEAAYGGNYDRLVDVKRRYDPANLFRVNHNIRPPASVPAVTAWNLQARATAGLVPPSP